MPRSTACALLVLSLTAFAATSRAQTAPVIAPDRPLTLEDAIALAVRKNFNLQLQSNNLEQQKDELQIARAIFDPTITAGFTRSGSESANTSTRLEGTKNDSTSFRAGIEQRLPWTNGVLSLNSSPALTREATNNQFSTLNPAYNAGVIAALNQPLLRNAGKRAAQYNLERIRVGLGLAFITYKNQVLNLIRDTENAYYNLVNARETLRIRNLTLETQTRFFEENGTRRSTGVATDLDVLNAEVGVANARRGVIQAEQGVRNAEEDLLNLINVPEFDTRPGPVKFEDFTDARPTVAASYKLARDYYPSTLTAAEQLKQIQLDLEQARRNLKPTLNLNASYGFRARSTDEGYWDVLQNIPNDHGTNWQLGLSYSMPWGRRSDKANYRQALLEVNSQKLRIEQAEQQLSVLVRQAVRAVEFNLAAVEIAAKATELSVRQYEQQKARFDAGLATAFLVLQAQDALENARFQELGAKIALRRAAVELRRLEGTSIERYRIQLPQ